MISPGDVFLDVVAIESGVRVVSKHPQSEHRRHVSIDVVDGRIAVNWGYDDGSAAVSDSGGTFADATSAFAVKGYAEGVAAILETLNYPRDERERAAEFLIENIPAVAPESLNAAMDVRAIDSLQAVTFPSILNLDFYSGDGERAERRRQAAKSIPILAGQVASTLSLKMTVDRSKSLTEAVIGTFDGRTAGTIGKAAIRKLSAVTDKPFLTDLSTVIEFASRVPTDWIPAGGVEWKAFCLIADGAINRLGLSADETTKFLKGCSGKWNDFASRLIAPLAREGRDKEIDRALPVAFRNLSEMVECFTNVVVLPLAVHGEFISDVTVTAEAKQHAFDVAKRMMFGDKSAPSLVEISRKWHSQRAAILDATGIVEQERRQVMMKDIPANGWPALCDSVVARNGLSLVPLNSPEQLTWEGADKPDPSHVMGLNHCVGGYSNKCRSLDSHIVSIREIDDHGYMRISTVEFARLNPTSNQLFKVQHYGYGDSTPIGKAQDAVDWFMEAVALGEVRLNRELMEAYERIVLEGVDGIERFCGFDWRNADTLAQALAPWAPYVDSTYRRLGFEDLLSLDELKPIRESIAPELIGTVSAFRS